MAEDTPPNPDAAPASEADDLQKALDDAQSAVDEMSQAVGGDAMGGDESAGDINLLNDVDLDVSIELGRTEMLVEDVLKLRDGSVVELNKLAGDPVDVYVNGRLVARGEVLVLNDNFCIRVSEIVADLEEQAEAAAADAQTEDADSKVVEPEGAPA